MDEKRYLRMVAISSSALVGLVALLCVALLRGPKTQPATLGAAPPDGCVACHSDPKDDPGGAHAAALVGCASCHLGDREASTKEAAHAGMEPEPGALSTVKKTCGSCHAREAERVLTSLMATGRGIVSVDRWAFGEIPEPNTLQSMAEVLAAKAPTPGEDHVRRLCGGCHLGTRKDNRDDAIRGVGSGCSACHVASKRTDGDPHPVIFGVVPDRQCLGCHSRSARLSLSYQGLAEISGATPCEKPTTLFDGRKGCSLPEDVHHAAGLECVDCHLHTELMGDGTARPRARQQLEIRCQTCHGPAKDARWEQVKDPISRDLLRMRKQQRAPEERVRLGARGTPVSNLRPSGPRTWQLEPKSGGAALVVKQTPADANHALKGHDRLSCAACHSAWIPTCPSCHTSFDPGGKQWDFGRAAEASGAWRESNDGMGYGAPGLAVAGDRIQPGAPGMIATLDATAAGGEKRELRLVSTFDPHTTGKRARSCASCHRSATALGLGTGRLELGAAAPRFTPAHDDGWTRLFPAAPARGTHADARGLNADEQRRVLQVGVCVECHSRADDVVWRDFRASVRRLQRGVASCKGRVPPWFRIPQW